MGLIAELIETIRDISQLPKELGGESLKMDKRYSSISKRSMEGILHFPVIVSRSIDIETMQMISKALEKQFASFTQTAVTMSPFLNLKQERDAIGYLRRFHQNTHTRNNLFDDTINMISSFESASEDMVNGFVSGNGELFMLTVTAEGSGSEILLANRKGLVDLMEGLRLEPLNSLYDPRTKYRFKDKANQVAYVSEARKAKPSMVYNDGRDQSTHNTDARTSQDNRYSNMSTRADNIENNYGDVNIKITGKAGDIPGIGALGAGNKIVDQQLPNQVLRDNDVKKANELVPTSMLVRLVLVDADGRPSGNLDFMAGVKATLHPVASDEIVENLTNSIRRGGKLFKTLRWTSGEISFAKDYVLNLTEIKDDATKEKRGNSRWWTALKRRARLSKLKKFTFLQRDLLPNTSIVLSIEEVEFIKSNYNVDLMNPNVVYKLMGEYFLISFVVVDSAKGIVHFLFDGHNEYQDVTFSGLERGDIAGRGVDFKDVLKLVQRV